MNRTTEDHSGGAFAAVGLWPPRRVSQPALVLDVFLLLILPVFVIATITASLITPLSTAGGVSPAISLSLVWIIAVLLFAFDKSWNGSRSLVLLLLICFAIRLILAYLLLGPYWPDGWRSFLSGENRFDAFVYHDFATRLAAQRLVGTGPWLEINYLGIIYLYAAVYFVFGANVLHVVAFNCLVSLIASVALFKLIRSFSSVRLAAASAIGLALLPDLTLWSALPMKETVVTCLFVLGVLSLQRYLFLGSYRWLLILVGIFGLLLEFRVAVALVLCISFLICVGFQRGGRFWKVLAISTVGLVLMFLVASRAQSTLIKVYGNPFSVDFFSQYLTVFRNRGDEFNAVDPASSLGVLTKGALLEGKVYLIPVRVGFFYLNPPPWVRGYGLWDPFRMSSALFVWTSLPAALFGLYALWRQRPRTYGLLIPFVVGSILISCATPFLDDRLRTMIMPLFIGTAIWGFATVRRWWYAYLSVPAIVTIGGIVYYIFKASA